MEIPCWINLLPNHLNVMGHMIYISPSSQRRILKSRDQKSRDRKSHDRKSLDRKSPDWMLGDWKSHNRKSHDRKICPYFLCMLVTQITWITHWWPRHHIAYILVMQTSHDLHIGDPDIWNPDFVWCNDNVFNARKLILIPDEVFIFPL